MDKHKGYNKQNQEVTDVCLKGTTGAVIYPKPDTDSSYKIMLLNTDDHGSVVIKGILFGVESKEKLEVWGTWEDHPEYGRQLKVNHWEKPMPSSEEQVIDYLSSKMVKGIGKTTAKRVVKELGADALNIIMNKGPEVLYGIKGISRNNADKAYRCLCETYEIQRIVMRLRRYGLELHQAIKAYETFKSPVVELIKQNPYILTKVSGIAFQSADQIAEKVAQIENVEFSKSCPYRIKAAIMDSLAEASGKGHCYLCHFSLYDYTLKRLNKSGEWVTQGQVEEVLKSRHDDLVIEGDAIYPKHLYECEVDVAEKLKFLSTKSRSRVPAQKVEKWIKEYEFANRLTLAPEQKTAVFKVFESNLLTMTGGPGTGKSTSVRAILAVVKKANPNIRIMMAAPTGKAADNLSKITGVEAVTIHRLIGMKPGEGPEHDSDNPLECDFLVVDEVSMLDIKLARLLFSAIAPYTKVLLIGDPSQLPSVEAGAVLQDILEAGLPSICLTKIFRQAQQSQIITNAHRINHGHYITVDPTKGDFYFSIKEKPEHIAQAIKLSVLRLLQKGYTMEDIQVLSPMKNGVIGTIALNKLLQEVINPPAKNKAEITRGDKFTVTFREGDKVLQLKNNYTLGVYNGNVGVIRQIATILDEEGEPTKDKKIIVAFGNDYKEYTKGNWDELALAYCITCHKAQGGQWPVVIMPISNHHHIMLARNLVYTGITRAMEKVALIGTEQALVKAIKNDRVMKRNTRLAQRLGSNVLRAAFGSELPTT